MPPHSHDPVHLDEAHWHEWADHLEHEGEAFLSFLTEAAARIQSCRGPAATVRKILDVGCGPGVGTCELARVFPSAEVVAVDASPEMLDRVRRRATGGGVGDRVRTHLADLSHGLDGVEPVDVIWASMSLHHVGDEVAALRAMRGALASDGLLSIAERDGPTRVLPDDVEVANAGLAERLDAAEEAWFAAMRSGLAGVTTSSDLPSMVEAAGFEVVEAYVARVRVDARAAGDIALRHLRRATKQIADHLDPGDLAALTVLLDADDPRGVTNRSDLVVRASRQIVIARPS